MSASGPDGATDLQKTMQARKAAWRCNTDGTRLGVEIITNIGAT